MRSTVDSVTVTKCGEAIGFLRNASQVSESNLHLDAEQGRKLGLTDTSRHYVTNEAMRFRQNGSLGRKKDHDSVVEFCCDPLLSITADGIVTDGKTLSVCSIHFLGIC